LCVNYNFCTTGQPIRIPSHCDASKRCAGIRRSKGHAQCPGPDQKPKDAGHRKFDGGSIDRLGRSLIDLLGTIQDLEADMLWHRVRGLKGPRPQKELKKGVGILRVAKTLGLGTGTVQRIKQEMGVV